MNIYAGEEISIRIVSDNEMIYLYLMYDIVLDLLSQTLDPCNMMNMIEPQSFEHDVTIGVESVPLQNGIIYHNHLDVSSKFSFLLTNTRNEYISILYNVVEHENKFIGMITDAYVNKQMYDNNKLGRNSATDVTDMFVFNLLEKSLYVSNLMLLSVPIPSEIVMYRNNRSQVSAYTIRIFDENVNENMIVGNDTIAVAVDRNNTVIGRTSFANYFNGLNSVDVIMTAFNRHDDVTYGYSQIEIGSGNYNNTTSSIVLTDYLSVTLLSDNLDDLNSQLDSNISMVFEIDAIDAIDIDTEYQYQDEMEELKCVWWNWIDNLWSSDGCILSIMSNDSDSVVCSCNHLTIFAILWNLDEYEHNSNNDDDEDDDDIPF